MHIKKINLADKLLQFNDHWSPKVVGKLNNHLLKVAKLKGEFIAHKHDDEDEMFLVIKGCLYIELESETLQLNAGEFTVIPKGVIHKPYAPEEVEVMLLEPDTVLNTGEIENDMTVRNLDFI
ncbi:cupin domain-containing protein [Marinicella sp. W31]|uniref:cupin domain-containing protein n=1 Tax=Marinicella sp. W31 TaxID=3023713 RepID=UPI00375635F4